MNRGSIKTLAAGFAEDPAQSRYAGLYDAALDRSQEQFALDTRALWKDAATITVVAGTSTYSLPTDFMFEKQVTHKGIQLKPITRARIQMFSANDWATEDEGTPKFYMIDPEEAKKQILLYPIPQASDAGANLILTYYPVPASSTTDSDVPLNSSALLAEYHLALAAHTAWLLLQNEPATPEKVAKKGELYSIYSKKVTEATDLFKNTAAAPLRMLGGRYWKRDV